MSIKQTIVKAAEAVEAALKKVAEDGKRKGSKNGPRYFITRSHQDVRNKNTGKGLYPKGHPREGQEKGVVPAYRMFLNPLRLSKYPFITGQRPERPK